LAEIFREVDEELKREQLNRYWRKYGKFAVAGLVLIVLGTAARVGWMEYQKEQRLAESERFLAALTLIQEKKSGDAMSSLAALAADANIGYATLARFREAALKGRSGDTEAAAAAYDALAKDGGVDPLYARLADLYYVLYKLETADPNALAARLEPLTEADSAWRYSALEMSALLAVRTGDAEASRKNYATLVDDPRTPAGIRTRAAEMLRALKN
jgi:hypothetical protein